MSEKKKELPNIHAELHTISPLPLELIAERIATLHYAGFPTRIDENNGIFIIKHPKSKKAMLIGRFMRWNGTFTRVDAASRAQSVREWASMLMPFIAFVLVILTILLAFQYGFQSIGLFLNFLCANLLIVPTGIMLIFWGMRLARTGDRKTTKALDEMLQALADKITTGTEGALEFDGSELSLEMLLSDEKYKHFRLGEDGEFEA